ncbi:putative Histidine kinase [uncultured Desulfobacterium sp.]|uniref:histidine kinase n=1 Tax=uncultured Desulfobacterium sp. TaxID=201089 RepID=A0A445N315_9BACT|nr:putative Histidine kinase [uncultured Desulfobacterium sp.]
MKTAEDILSEGVFNLVVVTPDTTVYDSVNVMVNNKIGSLLIKEGEKIVGVWTERDFMRDFINPDFDPKAVPIGACMKTGFGLISHSAPIYKLVDMFSESDIRHLIVEKNGRHIGLISAEEVNKIAIEEISKNYKSLFEHVGCGVYISSKEGRFLDANPTLLAMLGYEDKKEFLEMDIAKDLYLRPDDRKKFQTLIEIDGQVVNYEVDFKRKDSNVIHVLLTAHVRYDRQGNVSGYEGICVDQSHTKKVEEDYKRLFEHVGCGVYISRKEGKFLNVNQALVNMLGYESKEELFKIDIAKDLYYRPGDRRKFQEMVERDGSVINYEVDFKHKDGRKIPVLLTAHVLYDHYGNVLGYEGINVDQSQKKQMEQDLREAHDFLNEIIQSSPNAIIATDLNGMIIIWNRIAEDMLGYKAEDVLNKMNIEKIYSEGMANKVMQMVRSKQYGGVGLLREYPMVYVRQDGRIVEGNISASLIYDANGKEMAYVGIFVDLEERLKMERELRQTQEQLLQSEKLAAMGRLTSQIAHELNNPLYGIMNTLELMKTEISPQNKRRKILDMALSETVRLAEMLRKMLSFSKPDEEKRQLTNVNTLIDEILLLYEKQLRENNIKIRSFFAEDLGEVYASKNQLRQVFLNVIANARDAMPEGGILKVETKMAVGKVIIIISDTGVGIRPENLDKIFEAFFTTKDKIKGVGLGLSVCYGFIKDHGGDIKVESKYGSGTTFTIILPVHKRQEPVR